VIDPKTNLSTWSDPALFDVLMIMLKARPREVSVMEARLDAVNAIKAELMKRPKALYDFVEMQLQFDKDY